jgi:hypothetical protein
MKRPGDSWRVTAVEMETLSEALERLAAAGYRDDYRAEPEGLRARFTGKLHRPESLVIEQSGSERGGSCLCAPVRDRRNQRNLHGCLWPRNGFGRRSNGRAPEDGGDPRAVVSTSTNPLQPIPHAQPSTLVDPAGLNRCHGRSDAGSERQLETWGRRVPPGH